MVYCLPVPLNLAKKSALTMDEELQLIKKLETLHLHHKELDQMIDSINASDVKDEFRLHRLKKERLHLRDEISKLQDAIYPDIIA
jgi:hypothetical protein